MNKFPRSGFIPFDAEPRWNFWGNTKRGIAVSNDQAPEIGIQILAEATVTEDNHYIGMQCAVGALQENTDYFVSYILRPVTKQWVFIRDGANTAGQSHRTFFDIANMVIGNTSPMHRNPMIQNLGNGLVRVGLAFTPTDLDNVPQNEMVFGITDTDGLNTATSTLDDVIAEIYHAQIEEGNFPSMPEVKFPGQGQ
ncbi:MAG: hypothetical protein V3S55_15395 [Nitrospiraceae bacterium]